VNLLNPSDHILALFALAVTASALSTLLALVGGFCVVVGVLSPRSERSLVSASGRGYALSLAVAAVAMLDGWRAWGASEFGVVAVVTACASVAVAKVTVRR